MINNQEGGVMKVELIYRKKQAAFYSLEKVFDLVMNAIQKTHGNTLQMQKTVLPFSNGNIFFLILNLLSLFPKRNRLFHITGDVHYSMLILPKHLSVLTIHDLVFLDRSKGLTKRVLKWIFLTMPVKRAKYITTISEKSKQEIIRYTGCDPHKIMVIPNPVDSQLKYHKKPFNHSRPTLLFLGTKPNKNLEFSLLALSGLTVHIRIVGELTILQKELLDKYQIDYSNGVGLSDSELRLEFLNSDIVFFPSTYEGFGLPVIEGFKAGRPVITSNLAPMRDVAVGAALLVDPFSVTSIRNGIIDLIKSEALRLSLIEKGFEVVKQYDVESIAQQYINLWSKVAEENDLY